MRLPTKGLEKETVFDVMESYRAKDAPWRDGKTWGYVYDPGPEVEAVAKQAFAAYLSDNALDPTVFPSLLRFENEVVAIAIEHLGGGENAAGSFTSGGTESIMLAVKVARERGRERGLSGRPNIVLPVTAHASFQKAAHYLDLDVKLVPVEPETFRADVAAIAEAIDDNTILLVGSAPGYAHGVIDPIEAIGKIAAERDILFHVDACVGGFMLPYFRRLGVDVPRFDLTVEGVTSISMDLHKYAYCAKGASTVVYRDRALRALQIFTCSSWSGYTIVNPTIQSSKSGGPVAAAWAVLHYLGDEGYLALAKAKVDATAKIVAGVERIDGLRVLGKPDMNLVAVASDEVDVFKVSDEMKVLGWYLQPQLAYQTSREAIHLSVNPNNAQWVDALLRDLAVCVEKVRGGQGGDLGADAGQMLASMDLAEMDDETFTGLLQLAGVDGVNLPDRMADINGLLNALPSNVADQLLTRFINELFVAR